MSIYKYKLDIPNYVQLVINELERNNKEVYIVGGSIRDKFLGRDEKEIHDYDLCTDSLPLETYKMFIDNPDTSVTSTGIIHNTLKIWIDNNEPIDITLFGQNPKFVNTNIAKINEYYEQDIYDDLSRRDFTMNALAYNSNIGIIDVHNGIEDIRNRKLVFINSCKSRIKNDPFLILRAIRQSISLSFKMDYTTLSTVFDPGYARLLRNVSGWRRGNELKNIMSVDYTQSNKLQRTYLINFINIIMPEITQTVNIRHKYSDRILEFDSAEKRISFLFRDLSINIFKHILKDEFEYDSLFIDRIISEREIYGYNNKFTK